jgi:Domain of unknown function (DUF4278)
MKLIYRANVYDYDPTQSLNRPFQQIRGVGPAYTLTYRGVTHRIDPQSASAISSTGAQTKPATYELIYRGNVYRVQSPVQVAAKQPDRQLVTMHR